MTLRLSMLMTFLAPDRLKASTGFSDESLNFTCGWYTLREKWHVEKCEAVKFIQINKGAVQHRCERDN